MKHLHSSMPRILSVLLSLLLALGLFPVCAFADGAGVFEVGDGEGQYASVAAAYETLGTDGTIRLMKDVSETGTLSISGKNVTIDLNGHVLSYTGTEELNSRVTAIVTRNGASFTLTDTSEGAAGYLTHAIGRGVYVSGGTTFTLAGGAIQNCNSDKISGGFGGGVNVAWNGTFNFNGGTISGCYANWAGGVYCSGYMEMNGGTLRDSDDTGADIGLAALTNAQPVTIHAGTVSDKVSVSGGSITVTGGTFSKQINVDTGNMTVSGGTFGGPVSINKGTMVITGGSFDGTFSITNADGKLTVSGGTFADPSVVSDHLAEGYRLVERNGVYEVAEDGGDDPQDPASNEAAIGETEYETLTQAFAAAQDGQTVILLRTPSETSYTVEKQITITVNAGVKAAIDGSVSGIVNHGTLTLGAMTLSGLLENDGTLTVSGGTYGGAVTNTGSMTVSGGIFNGAVGGTGTFAVSDGSFAAASNTADNAFVLEGSITDILKTAKLENGYWVIDYRNDPAARILGKEGVYFTVAAAVADVKPNEPGTVIQLIGDCHEPETVQIPGNLNFTLDLNGHVLYGNKQSTLILMNGSNTTLTISDSDPTATHAGNAELPAGGVITDACGADFGGAFSLQAYNSNLNLTGGTIYKCSANRGGGAIYIGSTFGDCTMSGGCISECRISGENNVVGGAAVLSYNGYAEKYFTMTGGRIEHCSVTSTEGVGVGGAIRLGGARARISGDAVIDDCVCYIKVIYNPSRQGAQGTGGGAIAVKEGSTFEMDGGTISNCRVEATPDSLYPYAYGFGGAICAQGNQNKPTAVTMTDGLIINCYADREGGGVVVQNATFTMTGGTITECVCRTKGGGGLSFFGPNITHVYLRGGRMTNCSSLATDGTYLKTGEHPGGGGICGYDVPMELSGDYTITGCTVVYGHGGGIMLGNADAALEVEGEPVVLGNTANDAVDNVYLYTGVTVNVIGELEHGCSIGISAEETPTLSPKYDVTISTQYEDYNGNDSGDLYFVSDNPAYAVRNLGATGMGNEYGEVVLSLDAGYMKVVYFENGGNAFEPGFVNTFYTNDNIGTISEPEFEVEIRPYNAPGAAVTRDGFVFQSWNTAPDGSGITYPADPTDPRTATIAGHGTVHLYAQWHRIMSYSITIGSDLSINFYVHGIPADKTGDYTMSFVKTGTTSYLSKDIHGTVTEKGVKFTLDRIYPQDMINQITASLYDENKSRVASINSKSIQKFCDDYYQAHKDDTDESIQAFITLAADTLEYGAYCQRSLGVTDPAKLANNLSWVADWKSGDAGFAGLSADDDLRVIKTTSAQASGDVSVTGSGVLLGNSLYVYYTVEVSRANSHVYEIKDGNGHTAQAYTQLAENGRAVASLSQPGTYYFISAPISAINAGGNRIFYLYEDGVRICAMKDTVYSYIARNQANEDPVGSGNIPLNVICRAVYNYCVSARRCFDLSRQG